MTAYFLDEETEWAVGHLRAAEPAIRLALRHPAVRPEKVGLFHSATFSWDCSVVAFGDESGGGAARCTDPSDNQGRIWFVDTATGAERAS